MTNGSDERSPLLQNGHAESQQDEPEVQNPTRSFPKSTSNSAQIIDFSKEDDENPRNWPRRRKFVNVAIIAFMASKYRSPVVSPAPVSLQRIQVLSPLASSMFTPGISEIAKDLNTSASTVVGATTGFVVFLGLGPLILG